MASLPVLRAASDDGVDAQVRFRRPHAAERHGFVRFLNERRVAIRIGTDRHGRDPHLAAGAHDPPRDLAAIGDQDLVDRTLAVI